MKNSEKPKDTPEQAKRAITPARAAMGLAAAAAAAYGVYLLGAPGGRRRPATELANALSLRINYVPWDELHYAYYVRPGEGRPIVFLHSINAVASAHEVIGFDNDVPAARPGSHRPVGGLAGSGAGLRRAV